MLTNLRRRLFSLRYEYTNAIERQRAFGLLYMTYGLLVAWLGWVLAFASPALSGGPSALDYLGIPLVGVPLVAAVTWFFLQRGRLTWASWLFVGVLTAGVIPPILSQFDTLNPSFSITVFLVIPMVAAGLLLSRRDAAAVAVILLLAVVVRAYIQGQSTSPVTVIPAQQTVIDVLFIATAFVLTYFFLYLFSGVSERLNARTLRDLDLMREATAYMNSVKDSPDETRLLARSIDVVRDRMRYPVTQIYLFSEEGVVTRRMRSGLGRQEVGAVIQLRPADEEVLAEVRGSREAVVVRAGDARQQHLVAPARISATVPVISGGRVIAALDAQTNGETFTDKEIEALRFLSDQLAFALTQMRTKHDLERSLREQQDAATRFQTQLFEMRQTTEKVLGSGWDRFVAARGQQAYGFDLARVSAMDDDLRPVAAYDVPDHLRPALERGEVVVEETDYEQVISVPIVFRDETLGAMSFAVPKEKRVGERHLDMARTVANRLAVALESTRLFEQTQAQAYRERKASEVANALIGATDVRAVLNLAAETFNEAMGAVYTRVYLQPDILSEPAAQPGRGETN